MFKLLGGKNNGNSQEDVAKEILHFTSDLYLNQLILH